MIIMIVIQEKRASEPLSIDQVNTIISTIIIITLESSSSSTSTLVISRHQGPGDHNIHGLVPADIGDVFALFRNCSDLRVKFWVISVKSARELLSTMVDAALHWRPNDLPTTHNLTTSWTSLGESDKLWVIK